MTRKTKNTVLSFIMSGMLLGTIASCKKDSKQSLSDNSIESETLVKNGMLSFKSQENFNTVIKHYNAISLKDVDAELSSLNYQSLAKDTLNENRIADVKDPVIRRLLNKDGAINIGDKIYFIFADREYTIKNADFDVYKDLKANGQNSTFRTDTSKVIEKIIVSGSLNVKSDGRNLSVMSLSSGLKKPGTLAVLSGGTQVNYSNEYDNGRPERVKIFAWAENYTFSSSCGVSLIGEAYRKGGAFGSRSWREDPMYYSRIYGSYTITHYGIFTRSFDTGGQSLISECRNTFSDGSSGITPVINTLNATYEWRKAPQNPQESFIKNF
ncbi:hypothetical protein [Pedobacter sp. GR22-10]|uniref:hypothetical protein n=1 Tax=Pedobacter sp. GR22-10 TaxID=2994472 RepID=UPI00224609DE|nr:hypothetical protein [Pedobacter sp. GR22-10]MCX2432428.1 hypothetical protein [Pedobacter sp. GR22-10]